MGDEINFTYVEAAGSNVSPAYEILGEGGKAPATEDAAGASGDGAAATGEAPTGDENASGEPEDDVVQQNGAAQKMCIRDRRWTCGGDKRRHDLCGR